MAENYKHVKKFCAENFHGLRSTKIAMEQTLEVMFKIYVNKPILSHILLNQFVFASSFEHRHQARIILYVLN